MHNTYTGNSTIRPQEHPCNQVGNGASVMYVPRPMCTDGIRLRLPFQSFWLWQDLGQAASCSLCQVSSQWLGSRCPCGRALGRWDATLILMHSLAMACWAGRRRPDTQGLACALRRGRSDPCGPSGSQERHRRARMGDNERDSADKVVVDHCRCCRQVCMIHQRRNTHEIRAENQMAHGTNAFPVAMRNVGLRRRGGGGEWVRRGTCSGDVRGARNAAALRSSGVMARQAG